MMAVAMTGAACGAQVEPYRPTLAGIDNEGGPGWGGDTTPGADVSFAEGEGLVRVDADACPIDASDAMNRLDGNVGLANQYADRTVRVTTVGTQCRERELDLTLGPGESRNARFTLGNIIRVRDAGSGVVLHAWRIDEIPPLGGLRIVMRANR
jgi:hypothetical protein